MSEHIIPFKGRNHSGPVNQNLLWRDGIVYLMDNHRAALWCWQQHVDLAKEHHCVLHIDRHTDCLGANLDRHLRALPKFDGLTIEDYLGAEVQLASGTASLFRWDNYLSIHIAAFRNQLRCLRSIDHGDGDHPDFADTFRPRPDELPTNLLYWLQSRDHAWIVNIDLDYFFVESLDQATGEQIEFIPMFSDQFIESVVQQIRVGIDLGIVAVVTVCLTPSNFTPGWNECLTLSEKIFRILGVQHPAI